MADYPSRLRSYRRFETHDADEACVRVSQESRLFRHIISGPEYYLRSYTAQMEPLSISSLWSPTPREAWTLADGRFYVVALWLQGSNDYRSNGRRFILGPGEGILMEPNAESHIISSGDREIISIRIPADLLLSHARSLIGRPDQKPLEATGPIRFDSLFWRKAGSLIGELERAEDESLVRRVPGVALHVQFDLINHIVLSTPNSYQGLLEEEKTHPSVHRLRCRRVEEYMDAHLLERFSPEKMALVAGASWKSVETSFRIHYGKRPLQVFREKKLDRARLDLLTRPETTVAVLARRYAFRRLDQFRAFYALYHRESPQETRNKGRGWRS